uniref:RxLR effector protein n=1 Tax=Phytophthora ramorum TaxID=164328 RepID=H3H632_PHYRM
MKLLSTLAFLVIAAQCTLAAPERKLLRSGYESPVDFSTLTGGGATDPTSQQQQKQGDSSGAVLPGLPSVDSLTKGLSGITGGAGGEGGLSKLLPSGLPSTDALSSLTKGGKNGLPVDLSKVTSGSALSSLSALTGGGGLDSITSGLTKGDGLGSITSGLTKGDGLGSITNGITSGLTKGDGLGSITNGITSGLTKGGKLPSLPGLPISGSYGADSTKGLSGITSGLSGLTDGLALPSTLTSADAGKQAYSSEADATSTDKSDGNPTATKAEAEESPDQKPVV